MPDVTLTTNGVKMSGWISMSVRRSIEQFCDDFSLEVTNQRASTDPVRTSALDVKTVRTMADELENADEVVIAIDDQVVLTGYVDTHSYSHEAGSSSLRIEGRSRNGDLVDASATHPAGVWKKATLQEIARDLALPFSVLVVDAQNLSGKAFDRFRLEPGESVFDAIARASEMRSCLLTCNVQGDVELLQATKEPAKATLEMGVNILRATCTKSTRDRFSVYRFKGQTEASDDWNGVQAAALKGEIDDPDVKRHRPLTVLGKKKKSNEDLGKRAIWERNVRAGRGLRYNCTVLEWTDPNGRLWEPNTLVRVRDPYSQIDAELLLVTVDYTLNNSERTTTLELVDRLAYDPEPNAFKKRVAQPNSQRNLPYNSRWRDPYKIGR